MGNGVESTVDCSRADTTPDQSPWPRILLLSSTLLALLATRLPGLSGGLWHDEIYSVVTYIRPGPTAIWDSSLYVPNNHPLFSLLAWATGTLVGESEVVLRLWSVVPGIAGAIVLVDHLDRRWSPLHGVIGSLLLITSVMHQSLVPQARGYGIAFLATSVATAATANFIRQPTRRSASIIAVSGFAATSTIALAGIAYASLFGVLALAHRQQARRLLLGRALGMTVALTLWWAPLIPGVLANRSQEFGRQVGVFAPITGWIEDLGLIHVQGIVGSQLQGWPHLLVVAAIAGLCALAVLLSDGTDRLTVAALASPLLATYLVVFVGRLYIAPRFAFHLLPFLVPVIAHAAAIVSRRAPRPVVIIAAGITVQILAFGGLRVAQNARDSAETPREAFRDVADWIDEADPVTTVFTNSVRPLGLTHYLHRQIRTASPDEIERLACSTTSTLIVVEHRFNTRSLSFECESPRLPTVREFPQRTRGQLRVWTFPPTN